MTRYRMTIQRPKNERDPICATLYDLTRPEGQQFCCSGPVDTIADLLLGYVEKPEVSMVYEKLN